MPYTVLMENIMAPTPPAALQSAMPRATSAATRAVFWLVSTRAYSTRPSSSGCSSFGASSEMNARSGADTLEPVFWSTMAANERSIISSEGTAYSNE